MAGREVPPHRGDARAIPDSSTRRIEKLLEQRVEGLIYASGFHREVTLPPIAFDVPTVLVHCFDADGRLPSIVPDEEGGGHSATRRLIEAGHRRIGFINLEPDTTAARGRLAGYRRALVEAGIEPVDDLVMSSDDSSADGGYTAASALLNLADRPTAIFCGTDRIAMGAYDAIKEHGLSIPSDVAVVGFDNQELIAAYLRPKLTTVALPFHEMGTRGVEMLGAALAAGQPIDTRTGDDRLPAGRTLVGLRSSQPIESIPTPSLAAEKQQRSSTEMESSMMTRPTTSRRVRALGAIALAGALALTGCAGGGTSGGARRHPAPAPSPARTRRRSAATSTRSPPMPHR